MQDLIIPELVVLDEPLGNSKETVIRALAGRVAETGRAEANQLVADLMVREDKTVTGLSGGIAIPHCRSQAVKVASLCFARLKGPVEFGAQDGPADLIFMIVAPAGQDQEHLKLLQKLARKLVDKRFLSALRTVTTKEEVVRILSGGIESEKATQPLAFPRVSLAPAYTGIPAAAPAPTAGAAAPAASTGSPTSPGFAPTPDGAPASSGHPRWFQRRTS